MSELSSECYVKNWKLLDGEVDSVPELACGKEGWSYPRVHHALEGRASIDQAEKAGNELPEEGTVWLNL